MFHVDELHNVTEGRRRSTEILRQCVRNTLGFFLAETIRRCYAIATEGKFCGKSVVCLASLGKAISGSSQVGQRLRKTISSVINSDIYTYKPPGQTNPPCLPGH